MNAFWRRVRTSLRHTRAERRSSTARASLWLGVLAAVALSASAATASNVGANYVVRVYPPRGYYRHPAPPLIPFAAQVHLGFFDPFNELSTGFDGGFRIGPQISPNAQVGFGLNWYRRSDNTTMHLGTVHTPGGTAVQELVLSESTANLVPMLLFVQLSGNPNRPVVPYGGFGLGYEWLFLSADDFVTHESFDEVFGGFGWQVWAGAGFALDARTRINGELFFNECEAGNDVDVMMGGVSVRARDIVNVNGFGMRLGVSWQF